MSGPVKVHFTHCFHGRCPGEDSCAVSCDALPRVLDFRVSHRIAELIAQFVYGLHPNGFRPALLDAIPVLVVQASQCALLRPCKKASHQGTPPKTPPLRSMHSSGYATALQRTHLVLPCQLGLPAAWELGLLYGHLMQSPLRPVAYQLRCGVRELHFAGLHWPRGQPDRILLPPHSLTEFLANRISFSEWQGHCPVPLVSCLRC